MTIVTMAHARAVIRPNGKGLCARGMRAFAEQHGLDYLEFVREGVDAGKLRKTNNAFAEMAIAVAEAEEAENHGW